ncbi:BatA domain-containing protein [Botrimarina sp.]|uniref:BatA domain-containing protein n=1 Tax=Botrimarina sp. TaxID=2795802 RepID=UPI0032EAA8D1
MAFLSPLLLAGLALVAIPIALHLRRRRDPQRVVFPAMRLLRRNRHRTETQLRVRRWVLLALRCLLLAALAMALARPLLKPRPEGGQAAAAEGPAGEGTAVALVVDNGPNSQYQRRNQTRLEVAQELAGRLLAALPDEAPVVLADRSPTGRAALVEAAAAAARVERLAPTDAAAPLGEVLAGALELLADTPAGRREAYVFTDLSRGAWDDASSEAAAAAVENHPGVLLRLVDVGVVAPRNAAVTGVRLASESVALGEPLRLTATVETLGAWTEPLAVQLWLDGDAAPVKRDERLVEATGGAASVDFSVAGLDEGHASGFVRVVAGDAAPVDDTRHFAVEVRRPRTVLVAASSKEDAVFYRSAIDPRQVEPGVAPRYETKLVTYDAWARQSLAGFDAAVLLDPPPEVDRGRGWRRLYDLAVGGGGVGVFLGRAATLGAINSPEAQALLPAEVQYISRDDTYLRPTRYSHPILRPLAPYSEAIAWRAFPVLRRWETSGVRDTATVVAPYADGAPALIEQSVGRGRVVLATTPISDSLNRDEPWNLLPTGDDPWPFYLLANGLTDYLTGAAQTRLNYTAGEPVVLPLPPALETSGYVLRPPSGEAIRQSLPPGRGELSIPSATAPGAYRVQAGSELDRRFAVNIDPAAARLERAEFADLRERLGGERVELVRGPEEIVETIDLGRVGRELYGWVLPLAALAIVAEQLVSSRFYRRAAGGDA